MKFEPFLIIIFLLNISLSTNASVTIKNSRYISNCGAELITTEEIEVLSTSFDIAKVEIDGRWSLYSDSFKASEYDDGKIHTLVAYYSTWQNDSKGGIELVYKSMGSCKFLVNLNEPQNEMYFQIVDNEAHLLLSLSEDKQLTIPEKYKKDNQSYTVTTILEYAFSNNSNVVDITIPISISKIELGSFSNCSNLKKIIWLPNTPPEGYDRVNAPIQYVSNGNYSGKDYIVYDYLSSMFIVNGVKYVPISPSERTCVAFDCLYDESSENIELKETIVNRGIEFKLLSVNDYCCYGNSYILNANIDAPLKLGVGSFQGCGSLNHLYLKCEEVGTEAFQGCSSLNYVDVNTPVIGQSAFQNCATIDDAEFKINAGEIKNSAFSGCSSIIKADIKATNIGINAFSNCAINNAAEYVIEAINISESAFKGCASIVELNIKANIIGDDAFYGCSLKGKAQYFIKAKEIGKSAFSGCSSISELNIETDKMGNSAFENSATKFPTIGVIQCENIPDYAFAGCKGLEVVNLTTTSIGKSSFSNAATLNDAQFVLNQVETISDNSFRGASSLKSIDLNEGIKSIGESCFSDCVILEELHIPNSVNKIGQSAFSGCSSLSEITIGTGLVDLKASCFSGCSSLSQIIIPDNIISIGNSAFNGCTSLANVNIVDRKQTLVLGTNGSSNPLFYDCPLDEVYIGGNISYNTSEKAGYSPFYSNTSLKTVVINNRETEISDYEFYGCSNLKSISMGNGVRRIGKYAFSGCSSMESFSFGTGMKSIEQEAFSDCIALTQLICHALVPPICETQALDDINKWECQLFVPVQSLKNYKSAIQWKEFFFINGEDFDDDYNIYASEIFINPTEATINVGESLQLTATVAPVDTTDQTIIWTSTDDKVASVSDEGLVTALKEGQTMITATCGDVSAECRIYVIDDTGIESIFDNSYEIFTVYTLGGILIKKDCNKDFLNSLDKGIYIVVTGDQTMKISLK